jgi:hypothetical protein
LRLKYWKSVVRLLRSCGYHAHYIPSSVNMAPISDCTTVEQSADIRLLWSEGIKPSKIHRKTLAQYGENSKFINGWKVSNVAEHTSLMKTARAVRPLHERRTILNELVLWFKRTDELMSQI